jgi:hypothetical protein
MQRLGMTFTCAEKPFYILRSKYSDMHNVEQDLQAIASMNKRKKSWMLI